MRHRASSRPGNAVTLLFFALSASTALAEWGIAPEGEGWQLLKDGEPFYIRGAVAPNRFDVLRACGGNAVRTAANKASLDAAHAAGLAAMANLRVRGERDGMDWDDAAQVEKQKQASLEVVRGLKDHPAVMFWSVGNELDHVPGGKAYNPRIWERLNDIAVAIKRIDPRHPVMTVVGTGRMEKKVQEIAAGCRDMDLLGINAYGDIARATELARRHWPKPYAVTEWGPTGHWEVPKTPWRAPIEQTSSEKARVFDDRYRKVILADRTHCLGSFAFYWSEKQETTHTWYGLFCDGLQTESIDVLQHLWTGKWPANRAPAIDGLGIDGFPDPRATRLKAGQRYRAGARVVDPESDPLVFGWDIRPEVEIPPGSYAGGMEKRAKPIEGLIRDPSVATIEFTAPGKPGRYRLFFTAKDGKGHIAYGNIPFLVEE